MCLYKGGDRQIEKGGKKRRERNIQKTSNPL